MEVASSWNTGHWTLRMSVCSCKDKSPRRNCKWRNDILALPCSLVSRLGSPFCLFQFCQSQIVGNLPLLKKWNWGMSAMNLACVKGKGYRGLASLPPPNSIPKKAQQGFSLCASTKVFYVCSPNVMCEYNKNIYKLFLFRNIEKAPKTWWYESCAAMKTRNLKVKLKRTNRSFLHSVQDA